MIGPGATVVLVVGFYFLGRAYAKKDEELKTTIDKKDTQLAAEVVYSKDTARQMLTVMAELTSLIRGMDQRDTSSTVEIKALFQTVIASINELKHATRDHLKNVGREAA